MNMISAGGLARLAEMSKAAIELENQEKERLKQEHLMLNILEKARSLEYGIEKHIKKAVKQGKENLVRNRSENNIIIGNFYVIKQIIKSGTVSGALETLKSQKLYPEGVDVIAWLMVLRECEIAGYAVELKQVTHIDGKTACPSDFEISISWANSNDEPVSEWTKQELDNMNPKMNLKKSIADRITNLNREMEILQQQISLL